LLANNRSKQRRPWCAGSRNYGPEGNTLVAAEMASLLPGMALALVGGVLIIASGASGVVGLVAYAMLAVAIALSSLGTFRAVQASVAGRHFRGGRPIAK
jgi:hypothetical protein